MAGIDTETLQFDAAGAPFSARYGDVYASSGGALEQARHVFLGGNDLPSRWAGREQFVIVETGFGLGINFLATWQAWREDPRRPRRLHFVSVERHPLAAADLARCAPPALAPLAQRLMHCWPPPITGLHRLAFEGGAIVLTLALGDARTLVPELALGADAFYLDGFAPDRNREMWEPPLLKALARLARPGATLATWTVARDVRQALAAGGFEAELRPGFDAKRHMLAAHYAPRFRTRRHEPASPYPGPREAVVLGAGLAGCSTAAALARRGWQVGLIDAAAEAAGGASALPCGLLHPWLAADDSNAARLVRAGFLLARRQLAEPPSGDALIKPCGILQIAGDETGDGPWPELLRLQRWPADFVRWCTPHEAERAVGLRPRRGGLWFDSGAVVSAASWCRAMLSGQPAIRWHGGQHALRIEPLPSGTWRIEGHCGPIAQVPVVIVACAMDAPRLLQSQFAPVRPVRGRLTRLAAGDLANLRAAIAGPGTVAPGLDGRVVAGATYEEVAPGEDTGLAERIAHEGNLQRLAHLLAQPVSVRIDGGGFDAMRCVAIDRTPLAGAVADEHTSLAASADLQGAHLADLPRREGLYCSFAFGSRGLALTPLLGETLACLIEGEPLPIERGLAASVDPARFLLRRLRTARAR